MKLPSCLTYIEQKTNNYIKSFLVISEHFSFQLNQVNLNHGYVIESHTMDCADCLTLEGF